jgi:hypothetical protein
VNEAFENDSEQRDTAKNFSSFYGVGAANSTDEKRNVVCIVIIH